VKKQAKEREMRPSLTTAAVALAFILGAGSSQSAQQKGQYVPGQVGLNAELIPDPGFTYGNMTLNYSANLIVPAKGLYFYFKYEPEYLARAATQGRTFVFGGSWNLRFPREQAPRP
jgi:hypothetical protein